MPEPHSIRWASWTFVFVWLAVFLWDIFKGLPAGAGVVLLLAPVISLAMAWRWPFVFQFDAIQRLLLVPVIAWAIFISFALLAERAGNGLSSSNLWAIKPLISWAGLCAALVVGAGTALMLVTLFRSQPLPWAIAAAAIAAIFIVWVGQTLHLYAVIESVFLVVAVGVMTYAANRIAPKLPILGHSAGPSRS